MALPGKGNQSARNINAKKGRSGSDTTVAESQVIGIKAAVVEHVDNQLSRSLRSELPMGAQGRGQLSEACRPLVVLVLVLLGT